MSFTRVCNGNTIFIRKHRTTSSCTAIDRIRATPADVHYYFFPGMDAVASEGVRAMLRQTMIILATAAALTGALSADAFARGGGGHGGGGGHMGGGFGGGHIGGGFGGGHLAGSPLGGLGGAPVGSLGGAQFHGPHLGGGFHYGHHRFSGFFGGGTYGYVPSYDDYSYAD